MSKGSCQDFEILRNDGTAIAFTGEKLGKASSKRNHSQSRWSELNLYRTRAGVFVCQEIGRSTITDESQIYKADTATDLAGVRKFFGHGWLAQNLYRDSGLESSSTNHVA